MAWRYQTRYWLTWYRSSTADTALYLMVAGPDLIDGQRSRAGEAPVEVALAGIDQVGVVATVITKSAAWGTRRLRRS